MADLAGKTLGKYRLIEQLGRGGFASVYKAYQPRLDRYVAIKVLHPHLIEGEDFLARFEREAKAVAGLRHPHIIIVHDFDVDDNTYFMVMEFIEGQSLKERMEELNAARKHMPLAEVQHIIDDIASALDYAHGRGMLHRDIKPSNVVIDQSGDSFLADFGIARILSNTQFTATGALIGTPAYMSPEQGQGLGVSTASDVYSLGILLYELLVGRVPFDADTPLAIIFKHISDALPSVRAFRPELPEALERVTYKALAKHPEDRYQSAGELAGALRTALASEHKMETVEHLPEPIAPESTPVIVAVEPREVQGAKAATLAVEQQVEDRPAQDLAQALDTDESERLKAATLAVERDVDSGLDEPRPLPEAAPVETIVEKVAESPKVAPASKKKGLSKPLKVGGMAFIGLILIIVLGVILFNVFSPDETGSVPGIARVSGANSTEKPAATLPPKPTADMGVLLFEQGMVLLNEKHDYGDAIDRFDKAIRAGFKEAEVYYNRAVACHEWAYYEGQCGFEKAIVDFDQAIKLDPNRAYFYENRAWSFIHVGDFKSALIDYSKAIALEPDNPHFWEGKAGVFSRMGNFEAALEAIQRAIEIDPREPYFYDTQAWIYTQIGDLESAIKAWSTAIVIDPKNQGFWRQRAGRKYDLENYQGAIEDYNAAIELNPNDFWLYAERAHAYTRSGNDEAAIQDLDRMVEIDPNNADVYVQRGHVFAWMGKIEAAVENFQRAIEMDPENWEAYVKLGEIYFDHYQDFDRSLDNLNKGIEIAPPDTNWPYLVRGRVYSHLGDWESAVADFSQAIRITSDFPDPYGQRGYAYSELGMIEEARVDYERFLELTAGELRYEEWRQDIEKWLRDHPE